MKYIHILLLISSLALLNSCGNQNKSKEGINSVNEKGAEPHKLMPVEDFINGVPELPFPYSLELRSKLNINKYKPVDSLTFWTYLEPQESLAKVPDQRPKNYFVFGRITYSTLETGIVYGYLTGDQQVLSIAVFENKQKRIGYLFEFWASYLLNSPQSVSLSTVDADGAVNVSVWELKEGQKWNKQYQLQNSPVFSKSYFLVQGNYESQEKPESNEYDG